MQFFALNIEEANLKSIQKRKTVQLKYWSWSSSTIYLHNTNTNHYQYLLITDGRYLSWPSVTVVTWPGAQRDRSRDCVSLCKQYLASISPSRPHWPWYASPPTITNNPATLPMSNPDCAKSHGCLPNIVNVSKPCSIKLSNIHGSKYITSVGRYPAISRSRWYFAGLCVWWRMVMEGGNIYPAGAGHLIIF